MYVRVRAQWQDVDGETEQEQALMHRIQHAASCNIY